MDSNFSNNVESEKDLSTEERDMHSGEEAEEIIEELYPSKVECLPVEDVKSTGSGTEAKEKPKDKAVVSGTVVDSSKEEETSVEEKSSVKVKDFRV